jgi:hypothetical protein
MLAGLAVAARRAGGPTPWRDPAWVLPLLWPMYLVHQFEEHGIDLLGHRFAFLASLCATLGHSNLADCPADVAFVFAVNVVGCQLAFAMSWLFRRRNPLIAACAWGIPLVNAVAHLGPAVIHRAYNPGVLTSIILFVPLGAWMLYTVVRSGVVSGRQVLRIFASGIVSHAVLLGSLNLRGRGLISHEALLVMNGFNGLLPLAFGTIGVKPRTT